MAIDIIARVLALSGGGGGGGTTDYNDLSNRPQINGTLLRGNKTGEDLGLAGIEVVTELPDPLANDTIYVIPGNPSADPPVPDKFYVVEGGAVYQIVSGRVEDVDYNTEIINRPQINGTLLRGNKTGAELGLAGIQVVSALPSTPDDEIIYVIPGDPTADPPVPDAFYVSNGGLVYKIQSGRVTDVNYATEIINRPQIDNTLLKANNNTHEELELISEKDFVTESSGKTDGMEFLLPEGTPDNPIEITEINDSPEMKYANNLTSSNLYINTALDEINRILDGKVQIFVVSALPAQVAKNTIYFVESEQEGVYNQYIVDSLGAVHQAGNTQLNLDDYVKNTRTIGSHTLEHNITAADLVNDVKNQSATLTNKTINAADNTIANLDLSNFSSDVVKTAMPETPTDTVLLTAKAVIDYVKGTRATGSDAFTYIPNASQGYTISGDYDTNCPRQISKVGRRVNLSFCCKGSAVANSANWTSLGTVPTGYRPTKKTSIVAQVYSGTQNEAAGGYVDTSGWVVIWTNAKSATNNYQVRVNACWDAE